MQTKKQNVLVAGLFFLLAAAFTVITVISIIDIIDWLDYMTTFGIILTFAALVGQFFVFAIPACALGAYFMDMSKENAFYTSIRFSTSGWTILFMAAVASFVSVLVDYGFVFDTFLGVILALLPLVFTGVLYSKRYAYGNDLNAAKIASALYFLYLGIFNWVYTIATDAISSGALGTISFILSILLGIAIPGAFCYYYFKLEGKPANAGAPAAYGQPQQFGQPQYPQNPYQQQNPYGPQAPVPPVQQAPAQPQAPAAKFCPFCGAQMPAGSGFCTNCGGKLQ